MFCYLYFLGMDCLSFIVKNILTAFCFSHRSPKKLFLHLCVKIVVLSFLVGFLTFCFGIKTETGTGMSPVRSLKMPIGTRKA